MCFSCVAKRLRCNTRRLSLRDGQCLESCSETSYEFKRVHSGGMRVSSSVELASGHGCAMSVCGERVPSMSNSESEPQWMQYYAKATTVRSQALCITRNCNSILLCIPACRAFAISGTLVSYSTCDFVRIAAEALRAVATTKPPDAGLAAMRKFLYGRS